MKQSAFKTGRSLWLAAAFLFGITGSALAAEPLVDVAWLKANLGKPGIAIVDTQPTSDFMRGHIPGAGNTDFFKSGWIEERADKVPDMFPATLDKLAALIGSLGIDNNTHVVLVPPGNNHGDVGYATRIYWTFKALGHDNISLLNGGMREWTKDKTNPMENGAAKVAAKTFTPKLRPEMVITAEDVKAALAKKTLLVDHRPHDQHVGINRNPKGSQNGTLPGAANLPAAWMTDNAGGMFRSKAQIEKLFKVANVPTSGEQINFCNTGHLSSIGWFVTHELMGNKQSRMYDGSMVEWTLTKAGPVEQKISLD
jgi:thiosulfate/3-mercaptopyruvate sulfurtransferase